MPTYEIVEKQGRAGIHCLRCGMTSYHPEDVQRRYCGACHQFHEEPAVTLPLRPSPPPTQSPEGSPLVPGEMIYVIPAREDAYHGPLNAFMVGQEPGTVTVYVPHTLPYYDLTPDQADEFALRLIEQAAIARKETP